jgi:hypothetical protein
VDAIVWASADVDIYNQIKDLPEINQLLLRAGLRRIIEQAEHIEYFAKDSQATLSDARKYFECLKSLELLSD